MLVLFKKDSVYEDNNKDSGIMRYIMIFLLLLLFGAGGFVIISPQFEQNKPIIMIEDTIHWNLKDKLEIVLEDDIGIKYYRVMYNDGKKQIELNSKILDGTKQKLIIDVNKPKFDMFYRNKDSFLEIEVVDNSKWNYLNGNKTIKKVKLYIDIKKPIVSIIDNTRYIRRGGSALIVLKVEDENIKDAHIAFNDKIKFKLIPFYKENYYVSLIAWDVHIKDFKKVNVVVTDYAKNKSIVKVPLYIQSLKVKKDTIKISSSFIENVSSNVLEQSGEALPVELPKRFIEQNKVLRKKNLDFLRDFSIKHMNMSQIDDFKMNYFKRLRGSRTAAGFAERRTYLYKGKKIDEAWHLGMDWASVKQAPIKVSNNGTVIFNEYLGIYGNTIIIDHKLGLSTLYAHTSSSNVEIGQVVQAKQKIANTGSTGAVMGDHLHFGVLVQGIEVNPLQWMDKNWIKVNIMDIIQKAKKKIDEVTTKSKAK